MALKVGMPNLGHTMESGTVAEWLVSVGDSVNSGDMLGSVETEKATFDIESPCEGVILALLVDAGREVTVGTTIAVVGAPGDSLPESDLGQEPAPHADATPVRGGPTADEPSHRPKASPAARRRAEELGIDLRSVEGTGEDGLISREDVEAAGEDASFQIQPLSRMRRAIADATSRSWTTAPHVALTTTAEIPESLDRRSLTAAVVRACALALQRHPSLNGWLLPEGFRQARTADVGLVVAVPGGLVTARMEAAERKSTAQLATEIASVAQAAREDAVTGTPATEASFSVSSLGRWGVDTFTPIIAAPQVAILGVGRLRRAPREAREGIRFVDELGLTLVFDHRANDGIVAAGFLAEIVHGLEHSDHLEISR